MGELNGIDFGVNYKLSHFQALAGIEALRNINDNLNHRKKNSNIISSSIRNHNVKEINILECSIPSYQRLVIKTNVVSNSIAKYFAVRGVDSDMIKYNILPLYEYPILSQYKQKCNNADLFLNSASTISVNLNYSTDDLNYIIDTINSFNTRKL